MNLYALAASVLGLLFMGLLNVWQQYQARQTGADLQAAKTTETVNADVAKAIAAGRASSAEPDSSLRLPSPDSRD